MKWRKGRGVVACGAVLLVALLLAGAWGCKQEEEFPHQLRGDTMRLAWLLDDTVGLDGSERMRTPEQVKPHEPLTVEVRGEQLFIYEKEVLAFRLQGLWGASSSAEGVSYYSVEECHFEARSADGKTSYKALRGVPSWGIERASARVVRLDEQSCILEVRVFVAVETLGQSRGERCVTLHFSSAAC